MLRVPTVERRRLQRFARCQAIGEIKGIETAGNTDLALLILLDCNLPGTAPAERSEPDIAAILVLRVSASDREPWIDFIASRPASTLQHGFSGMNGLPLQVPFASPPASQIEKLILAIAQQVPRS